MVPPKGRAPCWSLFNFLKEQKCPLRGGCGCPAMGSAGGCSAGVLVGVLARTAPPHRYQSWGNPGGSIGWATDCRVHRPQGQSTLHLRRAPCRPCADLWRVFF
eukprot:scaffold1772_cov112-Isochrysis_galbana.AAC.6